MIAHLLSIRCTTTRLGELHVALCRRMITQAGALANDASTFQKYFSKQAAGARRHEQYRLNFQPSTRLTITHT